MEEQQDVLDELCGIAEEHQADLVLIAGDIFDTFNPPAEAVELLYRTLHRLSGGGLRPVLVIAGNHDSPDRIESADPLARLSGIFFIGYPGTVIRKTVLESGWEIDAPEAGILLLRRSGSPEVRLIATPYAGEVRLRKAIDPGKSEEQIRQILRDHWAALAAKYCDTKGINLLMAHLFAAEQGSLPFEELQEEEGERSILHPGGLELIPFSAFPPPVQYVALGHLHRPSLAKAGGRLICYSGTPLAYSLSEAEQRKRLVLVEAEPGKPVSAESIPLERGRKIRRGSFDSLEKALLWLGEHHEDYVEVTMEVDNYLEAGVRDAILEAHPRVLAVVPEIRDREALFDGKRKEMDLHAPVASLFIEYFRSRNGGADPEPELVGLLSEALAAAGAEEES
jgi:exonuclease SbcD